MTPQSPPATAPDPIDPALLLRPGCLATFEHLDHVCSTMERARDIAGDDSLLRALARVLEEEGFEVVPPHAVLTDLLQQLTSPLGTTV